MNTDARRWNLVRGALLIAATTVTVQSAPAQPAPTGDWRAFGADPTNTTYSPLDTGTAYADSGDDGAVTRDTSRTAGEG